MYISRDNVITPNEYFLQVPHLHKWKSSFHVYPYINSPFFQVPSYYTLIAFLAEKLSKLSLGENQPKPLNLTTVFSRNMVSNTG